MSVSDAYLLGRNKTLEKLALSDTAITAGTAFVSPLASGLTAEDGKGLQTSLSGMAGSLLGKKLFRGNNIGSRALGSLGAVAGSKVGAGLVTPDPEEIADMQNRGEFSKWDFLIKGARTGLIGAGVGAGVAALPYLFGSGALPALGSGVFAPSSTLGASALTATAPSGVALAGVSPLLAAKAAGAHVAASNAGVFGAIASQIPTAKASAMAATGLAAGAGLGRGAFSGYVVSPMIKDTIREATSKFRERQELRDQGKKVPKMKPPFIENTVKTLEQPHIKSKMDYIQKELI